jgi:chaperone required for assembly of F1-ATPase
MRKWEKKRFWQTVSVNPIREGSGYEIYLDEKILNTPKKAPLVVPTRTMAEMVALEWRLVDKKINPQVMPYTRFVNSSIDKIKPQINDIRKLIIEYGDCDLICYRAESPKELFVRQELAWDSLIKWSEKELNAPLKVYTGIIHRPQPSKSILELEKHVFHMSIFQLCALHDLVTISGSLILSLSVIKGFLTENSAWEASQVDEKWQIERWGSDTQAERANDEKRTSFIRAAQFFKAC